MLAAPAILRAKKAALCARKHQQGSRNTPAFPSQWFTAYFVLSQVTGLYCHLPRETRMRLRELNASVGAPGPHDFAVREFRRSSRASTASTASHRNVRDVRNAPLNRVRRGELVELICPTG